MGMLMTMFFSVTGGSLSKKSPKSCSARCEDMDSADSTTCLWKHFGHLIAATSVGIVTARCMMAVLGSLHRRSFTRVNYKGSPDWHRKMRKWRCADAALWILGIAWCAFAVNFICLFFANVAQRDQNSWMISAGLGFLEVAVLPLIVASALCLAAVSLLQCLARRYGVRKADITQHGSVQSLSELFSYTTDKQVIQRALLQEEGINAILSNMHALHE